MKLIVCQYCHINIRVQYELCIHTQILYIPTYMYKYEDGKSQNKKERLFSEIT